MIKTKKEKVTWSKKGDINERRDTIMRSANVVLKEQGYPHSLRMQDIANHLGLVKGNLYYYFKSKQDLIYHCRVKCLQMSLAALDRAKNATGSPAQRLRILFVEHILAIIEGDFSALLLADRGNISVSHRQDYVRLRDEFEHGVRDLIRDGIESGEFAKQDLRMAGFAILGSINWIPRWYHPDGILSAKEVADHFADFFINALKAGRKVKR